MFKINCKKIFFYLLIIALFYTFKSQSTKVYGQSNIYIKTYGGDIYVGEEMDFDITSPDFLSYENLLTFGHSGFIFGGEGLSGYGGGSQTNSGWVFPNLDPEFYPFIPGNVYHYFDERIPIKTSIDIYKNPALRNLCNNTLPVNSGYYEIGGLDVDCGSGNDLLISNGKKYVFFVQGGGPVNIANKIKVEKDAFFALIVDHNTIAIDKDLGGGSENDPDISGFFATDSAITTGNSTIPLYLSGTFIGNSIKLQRREPGGEVFIYRPDFLLSAPKEFLEQGATSWKISAP